VFSIEVYLIKACIYVEDGLQEEEQTVRSLLLPWQPNIDLEGNEYQTQCIPSSISKYPTGRAQALESKILQSGDEGVESYVGRPGKPNLSMAVIDL
jgi:hypothetical protein